jgi:hypothetical protein
VIDVNRTDSPFAHAYRSAAIAASTLAIKAERSSASETQPPFLAASPWPFGLPFTFDAPLIPRPAFGTVPSAAAFWSSALQDRPAIR